MDQWDTLVAQWMEAQFSTLDPEDMNSVTTKYGKSVYQLEKGLPPNGVVPQLKEKVESMKDKMPMVTDLCNPTLKQRHLENIYEILDYQFNNEDPMTLGKLVDIDAFQHIEAVQEVSAQASSEASLEGILKKVWI